MEISEKDLKRRTRKPLETEVRYVIVTPVRNEAAHLEANIASVVSQTVRPAEWILVDDGSTDATGVIIDKWASQHAWIKALHRHDRGFRYQGTGVIQAFYDGYQALTMSDWEYVVKLDGDLIFGPDYFEKCFEEFGKDPLLGIGGGILYQVEEGQMKMEVHQSFHVRGATKIYRRACWDALGGLMKSPGWDTVDELKAHFLGWKTRTFPDIRVQHRRPTGAVDGAWRNAVKHGVGNYVAAYHPLFIVFKCLKRVVDKPYGVDSLGIFYGFLSGYAKQVPRIEDPAFIHYIRRQQLRRLFLLKSIWQ
jgi:poly-beta-1,6-N-acetyl-D-glucosamine synthase